jgi:hypothetical protein
VYLAFPFPAPILDESKKSASPLVYPEPLEIISTDMTAPPVTTTFAVAPFQVPTEGFALVFRSFTS